MRNRGSTVGWPIAIDGSIGSERHGTWANGLAHSRVKLRLTKGAHIVVSRLRLPVSDTIVMTEGKRILFAIPWGERTIIGTTDTDYDGPIDRVFAEDGEIKYLLGVANRFFPRRI